MASFVDSTEQDGWLGTLSGTATIGAMGWTSYGCLGATAQESGSEFVDSIGFIGAFLGVGLLFGTFGSCSEGGVEVIPLWQDGSGNWHVGNDVPYSQVERRAAAVYGALHKQKAEPISFPAVIAETPEAYDAVTRLFPNGGTDSMLRTLDVLEAALTAETSQNEKAC